MRQPSRSSTSFAPEWSAPAPGSHRGSRERTRRSGRNLDRRPHTRRRPRRAPQSSGRLRRRGAPSQAWNRAGQAKRVTDEFLPIIHLVFANLKTWLIGIHHGVSERHLQAYLNEFTFRFNRRFYPFNAFRSLLGIASDAKAPTYAQLYSGDWNHATSRG